MRKFITMISAAIFVATGFAALASVAQAHSQFGDVANGRKIYTEGKGDDVPACASCHGAGGLGSDDMGTPRLAFQVFTYEVKQLKDFAADRREDLTLGVMNDIAKALTDKEKRDVITYVHTLKTLFIGSDLRELRQAGTEVGDRSRGRMIVEYGLGDEGIPACKSCHGYHGRSAGRMFPEIGGQRYVYLTNQLAHWKDKSRHNDPMQMMEKVAAHLSEKDIRDAAAFLTSALPYSGGNPKAPHRSNY